MSLPITSLFVTQSRHIELIVRGRTTSDGDGVKLTRVLTHQLQQRCDPFLMLDAFGSESADDYVGGFPDHPHRGFETITYMLEGKMRHRDSAGNEGLLESGGLQWMTAGRGVIHSEMPEQTEGKMLGFQLWLNLPSHQKMCEPWYRDFKAHDIPKVQFGRGEVKVIAGSYMGVSGAIQKPLTEPTYLDVRTLPQTAFHHLIPATHNAFIYVISGEVQVQGKTIPPQSMAVLENHDHDDGVIVQALTEAQFLLISGKPLNEPIIQHGPFVMNTVEEIHQTLRDFREGRLT